MSDTMNRPPAELLEMFERREGDVRFEAALPATTRRRIRVRRGAMAAVVVAAAAVVVFAGAKALPHLGGPKPATTPSPAPPATQLRPTVVGSTELYRWRVLAGAGSDGRVTTELQTGSLAGGEWSTVATRDFDPDATSFSQSYLLAGQFLDAPTTTMAWGVVPDGADHITFVPSEGCHEVTVDGGDIVVAADGTGIWATSLRCAGPAAFSARAADDTEIASNGYLQPSPSDQWALTSTVQDGIGWFLHRIVEVPTGIAYGDAGVPNDLEGEIREADLGDDALAWKAIPGSTPTPFLYGLTRTDAERVVAVLDDGSLVAAQPQLLPGDPFKVFWLQPTDAPVAWLVAVDADCRPLGTAAVTADPSSAPPPVDCGGPTN